MTRTSKIAAAVAALALVVTPLAASASPPTEHGDSHRHGKPATLPGGYKHLVVIYQENHSFDNLYGDWGEVNGEEVNGLQNASAANWTQRAQDGSAYTCLLQNDPSLTTPPLGGECQDSHTPTTAPPGSSGFTSHFPNKPFTIDDYIQPDDATCPNPLPTGPRLLPGGCTRDLVHRFYQEQYQLDGGAQDRYVTGSDAVGLAMGVYDTKQLPIYRYLNSPGAPKYVIADNFFQAAFGGSFLNHQWLIAARTPYDDPAGAVPAGKLRSRFSRIDTEGMPVKTYPLYSSEAPAADLTDGEMTVGCPPGVDTLEAAYEAACGRFAVNTVQPSSRPYNDASATARFMPLIDDDEYPNIGDRLSDAGISWAWYSGKWDAANNGESVPLFQYHHQPFNYFADYAPGQPGRAHLKDETEFEEAARNGTLPTVSLVKPYGAENEHPGYASEPDGSDHLVELIQDVVDGDQAGNTLIVVTYDEFGGQWDHVSPPSGQPGATDKWGPGTRIPALVIARNLKHSGVDHTQYDTTSILATIERSYGLEPLSSRDAAVNDLAPAVAAGGR